MFHRGGILDESFPEPAPGLGRLGIRRLETDLFRLARSSAQDCLAACLKVVGSIAMGQTFVLILATPGRTHTSTTYRLLSAAAAVATE